MKALLARANQPRRGQPQKALGYCIHCHHLVLPEQPHDSAVMQNRKASTGILGLVPRRRYWHTGCVETPERGREPQPGFLGRMEVK